MFVEQKLNLIVDKEDLRNLENGKVAYLDLGCEGYFHDEIEVGIVECKKIQYLVFYAEDVYAIFYSDGCKGGNKSTLREVRDFLNDCVDGYDYSRNGAGMGDVLDYYKNFTERVMDSQDAEDEDEFQEIIDQWVEDYFEMAGRYRKGVK